MTVLGLRELKKIVLLFSSVGLQIDRTKWVARNPAYPALATESQNIMSVFPALYPALTTTVQVLCPQVADSQLQVQEMQVFRCQ